jgi:hypothetical protein
MMSSSPKKGGLILGLGLLLVVLALLALNAANSEDYEMQNLALQKPLPPPAIEDGQPGKFSTATFGMG